VKTVNKLSLKKSSKNHVQVEGEASSFQLILGDCPVGGSSVGGPLFIFLYYDN